jgi:hypothetical protein
MSSTKKTKIESVGGVLPMTSMYACGPCNKKFRTEEDLKLHTVKKERERETFSLIFYLFRMNTISAPTKIALLVLVRP